MSLAQPASAREPARHFYFAVWRWHFYAGLYVAPFLAMLAVTGLIMVWSTVFVGRDGEKAFPVVPAGTERSVTEQAAAALSYVPGGVLKQYIAPRTPETAALFRVNAGDAAVMVAVDPYKAEALGAWPRRNGWYDFAETIHGSLMIGTVGDRLIEIACGFGIVLIVTGLYLWWPRARRVDDGVLIPNLSLKGRMWWKSLHKVVGFWSAGLLLVFLLTGLSWAGVWGEKFTQAWNTFPIGKWYDTPLSDVSHAAALNDGGAKNVPWTLEQTPMPVSGSNAGTPGLKDGVAPDLDGVVAYARQIGFDGRFQLNIPVKETDVWSLSRDSMSYDSSDPTADRIVHIDRYTGKVLADIGYRDYAPVAKAMAIGVAFHEGEMGLWNLVLVTIFCLSILFLSVSGLIMWWKRRPAGTFRLAPPPLPDNVPMWKGAMLLMLVVSMAFPLTGLTLMAVLALDMLVLSRVPALRHAFG